MLFDTIKKAEGEGEIATHYCVTAKATMFLAYLLTEIVTASAIALSATSGLRPGAFSVSVDWVAARDMFSVPVPIFIKQK